ncbi:YfgM family protein [Variovorax sp. VNK109]|uniref:YfgM family protein n=1 Tax=Variovorax sp. VNK109 TaxID=3400919 RepID=UPI003C0A6621
MAQHFDLEEQEQLDQLKHFWNRYGNAITWVLILALGSVAAWNGYNFWERRQAGLASAMYDEVERAAQAGDTTLLDKAFADIKDQYGRTTYAAQAGMLAARTFNEKGNGDAARAALTWVSGNAKDEGYKALARLRLAALLMDTKAYDDALKVLAEPVPAAFNMLVADRKGDVLLLQGKRDEAKAEYLKAHAALDPQSEYRQILEIKLTSLGVDTKTLNKPAGTQEAAK